MGGRLAHREFEWIEIETLLDSDAARALCGNALGRNGSQPESW
jgi:hypothetical protein